MIQKFTMTLIKKKLKIIVSTFSLINYLTYLKCFKGTVKKCKKKSCLYFLKWNGRSLKFSYILDKSVFSLIQKQKLWFNPILTGGGDWPLPLSFFCDNSKSFWAKKLKFSGFSNTCPSLKAKSWSFISESLGIPPQSSLESL